MSLRRVTLKKSRLLGAVCCYLFSAFSQAATITYTGSDLFSGPSVSFPTTTPTLDGTSLIFSGSDPGPHKLLVLPIFPAGDLPTSSPTTVSISLNLTRLACDTSIGKCAGGTADDSDYVFLLGDGSNLVGAYASDGAYDGYNGQGGASVYTDLGDAADYNTGQVLFIDSGYPSIGSSFDVNLILTLDTETTEDLSFLSGSGTATELQGLDRTTSIDFVFLSEGDPGEQYQINSLSITSAALVPIPAAAWLFGSGLLGLIGVARRKAYQCYIG